MDMFSNCGCRDLTGYFNREPEKLVLDGYRYWTFGVANGTMDSWQDAWNLYSGVLGSQNGRAALNALSHFIKTLGRCASCPLRMFRQGSVHICRDETIILGLIASVQHADHKTVELCLNAISCDTRCEEVATAAADFALTLKALDQILLPIPLQAIEDVLHRAEHADYGGPDHTHHHNNTLH